MPNGIPIIKPNPTKKEGVIATSGLLAIENRMMNSTKQKNNKGLVIKPVIIIGTRRTKFPVAGMIAVKFTVTKTINVEIIDTANPGRKTARLLPIHISLGLSGVAKRDDIFPLTFSLVTGKLAKAQINVMRIKSGRK